MSESNNGGIGLFGALGVLFIGLKLTGYIDWDWIIVLAPLWAPLALSIILLIIIGVCVIAWYAMKAIFEFITMK